MHKFKNIYIHSYYRYNYNFIYFFSLHGSLPEAYGDFLEDDLFDREGVHGPDVQLIVPVPHHLSHVVKGAGQFIIHYNWHKLSITLDYVSKSEMT